MKSTEIEVRRQSDWKAEKFNLFSNQKWRQKKGELRLKMLLTLPENFRKGLIRWLDTLREFYDDKGFPKKTWKAPDAIPMLKTERIGTKGFRYEFAEDQLES